MMVDKVVAEIKGTARVIAGDDETVKSTPSLVQIHGSDSVVLVGVFPAYKKGPDPDFAALHFATPPDAGWSDRVMCGTAHVKFSPDSAIAEHRRRARRHRQARLAQNRPCTRGISSADEVGR
jgi:hypothetical protein